jgi:CBS domain-containing protein
MRSPFTGIIFSLELTHDVNMLAPLLAAVTIAHAFTTLLLKRSILTEKISRRGYHLSREYSVDPLEILFVREVMRTSIAALPAEATGQQLSQSDHERRGQHLYPVIGGERRVAGVITRKELVALTGDARPFAEMARRAVVAHEDEPLRVVVNRMAATGLTRFPVLDRPHGKLVGMVSLEDLLRARTRNLEEERYRERVLRLHLPFRRRAEATTQC